MSTPDVRVQIPPRAPKASVNPFTLAFFFRSADDPAEFLWCPAGMDLNLFVPKIVSFYRKTCRFCHCEEGAILRPTRQSLTERFAIPERGMMKRNEPESENEAENADCAVLPVLRLPLWVFLLASCFPASPRDAMPLA